MMKVVCCLLQLALLMTTLQPAPAISRRRPNIIFILADDLGHGDVSWVDSRVRSPVLEELMRGGIRLTNYYAQEICTPSRTALMTGLYPIHTGTQIGVFTIAKPFGLGTRFKLLPEYLRDLGYNTHMVGKWHLGHCSWEYVPTRRGFTTFNGFYSGFTDYYTRVNRDWSSKKFVEYYDFRHNETVDREGVGVYSPVRKYTGCFKLSPPFFLYLSFGNVHAPKQAPVDQVRSFMEDGVSGLRALHLAQVSTMDEAIGDLVAALKRRGLYENTLIAFSSDNGGDVRFRASNHPFRGSKGHLLEGGTRVQAFLHAPFFLTARGATWQGLMHITDWLPTLYNLAGGNPAELGAIDGIDLLDAIANLKSSPRTELLYNVGSDFYLKDREKMRGAIRHGPFKLIQTDYFNRSSDSFSLYNLVHDPWEVNDVSREHPMIKSRLLSRLWELSSSASPPLAEEEWSGRVNWAAAVAAVEAAGPVVQPGWCRARY